MALAHRFALGEFGEATRARTPSRGSGIDVRVIGIKVLRSSLPIVPTATWTTFL
jgi:hypothetical protein